MGFHPFVVQGALLVLAQILDGSMFVWHSKKEVMAHTLPAFLKYVNTEPFQSF